MLNELEVINFQGHVHSYFEFHPRFNVIRGTSHHGKSSIVRAILWALENEPYGIDYRNWDKDEKEGVESHLSFEQGSISRIKNKKFNGYKYSTHSIDEDTLEAMRSDVPDEIRHISYMDRYNIRGQDDGYFLLRDSPGNVARQLNEKSGLEDIDKVSKIAKGLLDSYKTQLKFSEEELEKHNTRKDFLDSFKQFQKPIQDLDSKFEEFDDVEKSLLTLTNIWINLTNAETKIAKCEKKMEIGDDIKIVSNLLDRRLKIASKYTSLRLSLDVISKTDSVIKELETKLEQIPLVNDLNLLINEREQTLADWKYILQAKRIIENTDRLITDKVKHIKELDVILKQLSEQLNNAVTCPVCGADKEHWKHEIST